MPFLNVCLLQNVNTSYNLIFIEQFNVVLYNMLSSMLNIVGTCIVTEHSVEDKCHLFVYLSVFHFNHSFPSIFCFPIFIFHVS